MPRNFSNKSRRAQTSLGYTTASTKLGFDDPKPKSGPMIMRNPFVKKKSQPAPPPAARAAAPAAQPAAPAAAPQAPAPVAQQAAPQQAQPAPQATGILAPQVTGLKDAESTNYNAETYSAAGYSAPEQAQTAGYGVSQQNIDPTKTSAGILASMTSGNSKYMQAVRTNALQKSNRSGNLNTSTAVGAAELAAIQAAQPFALNDSAQHFNADRDYVNAQNREGEFGASASNQASMQENRQQDQSLRFGADANNVASRTNSAAINNASQYNASADNRVSEVNAAAHNRASEVFATAKNAVDRDAANNTFKMSLAEMDKELSTYKTDVQRSTAIEQMGIHALESGMAQGIFADRDLAIGYLKTVGTMIPELGIQIAAQAGDQAASSGAIV